MTDASDEGLFERFVQGDQEAFHAIFRRYEVEMFRWILRIVRDAGAAEDILVEAFWRAYRGRARFNPSRNFGAWMRRIATNTAIDHLNQARLRAGGLTIDEKVPVTADPDMGMRESISLAFNSLPPKLGVVAILALVEEQPYAEIADALNVPLGTVKSRLFRATQILRKELARLGIQP